MKQHIRQKLAKFIGITLLWLFIAAPCTANEAQKPDDLFQGIWGCQSVYGGAFTGRSCRTWPWLKLNADGSYTWGSEQGRWVIKDKTLRLSGRKGTGRLNDDGQLVFEYEMKGTQYRQVLYKRQ